jgi:hypothetical protein
MGFIAGFLLMQLDCEEKTFWMFTKLMDNENCIRGLFSEKLINLKCKYYQM